jgi:four helix bundle protein
MAESALRTKSKEFAIRIIHLNKAMQAAHPPASLTNQLLRSATSIGANIHEAQYAQGNADFISKLEISLKEANETEYWLELLFETGYMKEEQYRSLRQDCGSIRRMLIAACKTMKSKMNS